jgi:hypothetical protein
MKKTKHKFTYEDINRITDDLAHGSLDPVDLLAVCIIGCDYGERFLELSITLQAVRSLIMVALAKKLFTVGSYIGQLLLRAFSVSVGTDMVIVGGGSTAMVVVEDSLSFKAIQILAERFTALSFLMSAIKSLVENWEFVAEVIREGIKLEKEIEDAIDVYPDWLFELIKRVRYYMGV